MLAERARGARRDAVQEYNLVSWNTILKGYAQQGDMDIATTCFRRMPESRDIMEHIDLWVYKDEGALSLLSEMTRGEYRPDPATLSSGYFYLHLSCCSRV